MFAGYSYNERSMLSLGMVDPDIEFGTEVTLVWGEEDGGSKKPMVERHMQAEIRAIVSPAPYSEVVRGSYDEGWRSKAGVASAATLGHRRDGLSGQLEERRDKPIRRREVRCVVRVELEDPLAWMLANHPSLERGHE